MTTGNRKIFSAAVIALALIAAVVCSIVYLLDAADDADRSTADTAATRILANSIKSKRPLSMRSDSVELASQISKLLDASMKTAEIDPENLERISPQPARQSGQSDMTEIPLELNFRQISLRQLLAFVSSLTAENNWLTVRDLHIMYQDSPSPAATAIVWNVEITISYLANSSGSGTAFTN